MKYGVLLIFVTFLGVFNQCKDSDLVFPEKEILIGKWTEIETSTLMSIEFFPTYCVNGLGDTLLYRLDSGSELIWLSYAAYPNAERSFPIQYNLRKAEILIKGIVKELPIVYFKRE